MLSALFRPLVRLVLPDLFLGCCGSELVRSSTMPNGRLEANVSTCACSVDHAAEKGNLTSRCLPEDAGRLKLRNRASIRGLPCHCLAVTTPLPSGHIMNGTHRGGARAFALTIIVLHRCSGAHNGPYHRGRGTRFFLHQSKKAGNRVNEYLFRLSPYFFLSRLHDH
jgi:hypothetical protein